MSLVAAYSDSENESEGEEIEVTVAPSIVQNKDNENGNMLDIEDEDQWQSVQPSSTRTKDSSAATKSSLFSLLPQPKDSPVNVIEEKEDEFMSRKPLSDTVISTPASSSNSIQRKILNLPKPVKGTKKQPVKISIPTLRKVDDDSDSDEEESKKTIITNMSKSTLFSMLPKPRHSVTVGQNKNRVFQKETNRMLMPHSLTKKKEVNTDKVVDSLNPVKSDEQSDDDEDDVSSDNFFSLDVLSETINNENGSKEVSVPSSTAKTVTVENSGNLVGENSTNSQVISPDNKQITSPDNKQTTSTDDKQKTSNSTSTATKNNAFFANLFKKTEVTSTTSAKNSPDLKQSVINVSIESNNKSNEIIQSDIKKTIGSSTSNSVTAPYGTVTEPYSSVTEPYGSETTSNNSATEPYNSVTETYSNVTKPYSSVPTPFGGVSAPYGGVTSPYSSVTEPYGQVTEIYNNAATQYGSVTAPYGETSLSYASHSNSSESHGYPTSGSLFQYAYQTKAEEEDASQPETSSEIDYYHQPNQDLPVEALKALQGSKRRHEEVNIIDVHADQIHGGSDEYLRNLTKENVYASKKAKRCPSKITRKKKASNYLLGVSGERTRNAAASILGRKSGNETTNTIPLRFLADWNIIIFMRRTPILTF
ncbi:uncharacterized protein LOC130638537 isoform X1 [Hydractinia symbiolongicarpus]|uniref:uncharacterized protein LOC130638537 isoform X1 n=1 Tax=Hydractinia symbiolongicarpus TaxID=13093 RepID=UPI00254D0DE6|nr:uncharacterized protein LOC130638537 isoform X1 [Hydractinia symbiolongicarpus]